MLRGTPPGKERTLHGVLQTTPDARASQSDKAAVEKVTKDL